MDTLMEEIIKAMKTSSLKGVPKIISSPTILLRTIWTVAVLCFLCVCILTVSLNIQQYLQYPTITNVQQKHINKADPNGTSPFPSIAICNTNPFSSNRSAFIENGLLLPEEFLKKVEEVTACIDCSKEEAKLAKQVRSKLLTSNKGYLQYAGLKNLAKVSPHNTVLQCEAMTLVGSQLQVQSCEESSEKYTFYHPEGGICHAYSAILSNESSSIGYSFDIYLNNKGSTNRGYISSFMAPTMSGVSVFAFNPFQVPNMLESASLVPPGVWSSLNLKSIRTDRLSTPYHRECIDENHTPNELYGGKSYQYSQISCFGECTLTYVADKCNCTDIDLIQNPLTKQPEFEFCASLRHSLKQLFEHVTCAEEHNAPALAYCIEKCKEPCSDIHFEHTLSSGKWPLPAMIGSFYKETIEKNPDLLEDFRDLQDVANALHNGDKEVPYIDELRLAKAIEENFARVMVYFPNSYYTHYETKPKLTFPALISQLGGSFNLWSGITVVIFVELLDLVIKIIDRKRQTETIDTSIQKKNDCESLELVTKILNDPSPTSSIASA